MTATGSSTTAGLPAQPGYAAGAAAQGEADARMPAGVKLAILGVLGTLLLGTLYLIAVRGQALILDLSKLGQVFCF